MARKRRMYSASAVEDFIRKSIEIGYHIVTVCEGTLGYGKTVLVAPEGYFNYIIQEVPINCWASAHTVSRRKKLSNEVLTEIEEAESYEI